jgi:hypothetical protein
MSHFTVLVVGDVDEQLAPFDENLTTAPRREHLDTEDIARMAEHYNLDPGDLTAFAEQMEDWNGCPGGVDDRGLYAIASSNENARWDWYEIGGRWSGLLKLKPGADGAHGPADMPDRADAATKAEIDLDGMRDEAEASARETWRLYAAAIHGTPRHTAWSAFTARVEKKEITIEEARLRYADQPRVKAFDAAQELKGRIGYFASPDDFPETEDEYVARHRAEVTTTFAYVRHGEWRERGQVGWFGTATNEKESDAWATEFNAMLASLPDDEMLTVVDCHI